MSEERTICGECKGELNPNEDPWFWQINEAGKSVRVHEKCSKNEKRLTWHLTEHDNLVICNSCYEKLKDYLKQVYEDSCFSDDDYYINDWNVYCCFCDIKTLLLLKKSKASF